MSNPGGQIKVLGKVIFVILILFFIGAAIYIWSLPADTTLWGFVIIAVGGFTSWLLTIFLIAFGELVESNSMIRDYLAVMIKGRNTEEYSISDNSSGNANNATKTYKKCSVCGTLNEANLYQCKECGFGLDSTIVTEASKSNSSKPNMSKRLNEVKMSTLKICPKCGLDNSKTATYCEKCGTSLK